jgi:hypothetical protein
MKKKAVFPKLNIQCPICKGKGVLTEPLTIPKDLAKERIVIAKALREKGYSIREIMKLMNYKSPLSVTLLLKS